MADLHALLIRRGLLAGLEQELAREVGRRTPLTITVVDEVIRRAESDAENGTTTRARETVVSVGSLAPGMVIATEPDLDDWLKRLRTQLSVLLPVRIDADPEA